MNKILYLVLLFFIGTAFSFSQKSFSLKGKISDENKKPIEAVTIYLSTAKDSTLINYTITDVKGEFDLQTNKVEVPTFIVASMLGFTDYSKEISSVNDHIQLGEIILLEDSNTLDELVIKSDVAPIRVKQDTIEFNAASFKVRPDSNVKTLLEQLPGVTVDADGKIKYNGKEVPNILVNGKPFFGADGKIAIENLPADIINKVQVSDLKTKEQKLSGEKSDGETVSINLTIDEDKNKGFFGRINGGYGTDDRYESSLLANYFQGETKLSILASSNNINSTGFSQDEVFDNMKGGRNSWTYNSSFIDDSYNEPNGITKTNLIGINYNDSFNKKVDVAASYVLNDQDNKSRSASRIESLLPENRVITYSEDEGNSYNNQHKFTFDFEIKIDSTSTLAVVPIYEKINNKNYYKSISETFSQENELINNSNLNRFSDSDRNVFQNSLIYNKRFKDKSSLTLNFNNQNSQTKTFTDNQVSARFFEGSNPDDIRNQNWLSNSHQDRYDLNLKYRINITKKQVLSIGAGYLNALEVDNKETFDFNPITDQYSEFNELQSNKNRFLNTEIKAGVGYENNYEKGNFRVNLGSKWTQYELKSLYNQELFLNKKNEVLPDISLSNSFKFGKSTRLYISYRYSGSIPSMNELLPYQDLSSTLSVRQGNPNLKPKLSNGVNLNFSNYDYLTRSGYYIYAGGSIDSRGVMNVISYDEGFKSFQTYENTSGTGYLYAGASFNKSYKLGVNTLSYELGLYFNANKFKGKTNDILYSALSQSYYPSVKLTWDYNKVFIISPSYSYDYNVVKYTDFSLDKTNNYTHKLNLQVTSYLPENFILGADVGYNYNSMLSSGFRKDFTLLNASIGYKFLQDQLTAKVKAYDLLNQNLSSNRYISPTSIQDSDQLILKRYVMFSLSYKLDKFAGKKKDDSDSIYAM